MDLSLGPGLVLMFSVFLAVDLSLGHGPRR
jgi:hypothetical protein